MTISLVGYNYTSHFLGGWDKAVSITDDDIAKANGDFNEKGEVVLEDEDFEGSERQTATSGKSRQEELKKANDGSEVLTMYDGYGNKTETREFIDHARIKMIIVRTDTKGQKRVFVYGHYKNVTGVPENMVDIILTAPADAIANAAKIYDTKADIERRKEERAQQLKELEKEKIKNESPELKQPGFEQKRSSDEGLSERQNSEKGKSNEELDKNQ